MSYQDENEMKHRKLSRGDVFRLITGTLFSMQSSLDSERQKLRIIAIFENSEHEFNVRNKKYVCLSCSILEMFFLLSDSEKSLIHYRNQHLLHHTRV